MALSYDGGSEGSGWSGAARGLETRERLIRAAEGVFAERGIAGAQLREIGRAAGQRNNAAVHYYFGDKQTLVRAVLESRVRESETMRACLVRRLARSAAGSVTARAVVDAALRPLFVHLGHADRFLPFLSHLTRECGLHGSLGAPGVAPALTTLRDRLSEALPDAAPEVVDDRWTLALESGIHALALHQAVMVRGRGEGVTDLDRLIDFLTAGIEGPGLATTAHRRLP